MCRGWFNFCISKLDKANASCFFVTKVAESILTISCPSCSKEVSEKAFDCPNCGHPLRKLKRGFFGLIFKWLLIAFNILMLVWLVSYTGLIGESYETSISDAERTGTAIGGTLGVGLLLVFWVLGDIILGLATVLTRPRK